MLHSCIVSGYFYRSFTNCPPSFSHIFLIFKFKAKTHLPVEMNSSMTQSVAVENENRP